MSLADALSEIGLTQYLDTLEANGFDTLESLVGIETYFDDLGIKLGHRKRFIDLSVKHSPAMDAVVAFMTVRVDTNAHWGWGDRRKFMASSVCRQWPRIARAEVQNWICGKISANCDSTIEFSHNRDENWLAPRECKADAVFFTTLRDLYAAGYDTKDWKVFEHKLNVQKLLI